MTTFQPLLQHPLAQAIGWALLQFIWQGTVVAALTAVTLVALRRGAADVRYVVASIGLALMLTLPIVTAMQRWRAEPAQASDAGRTDTAHVPAIASAASATDPARTRDMGFAATDVAGPGGALAWTVPTHAIRADVVAALFAIWLLGVSVLSMRLLTGWLWVQRMRSRATSPARQAWQEMSHRLTRRLHLHRVVMLLETATVDVPTVVGWLKPVVLLPASALGGLSASQVEAILAHELAHIRRHDYLVNLLQTLVETLLFYHPGVWWISHRIRVERENCCDDLAVSLCGDPVGYANALADLEAFRASRFALAATGGSLLDRVRRLVGAPPSHAGRGPAWLAGVAALTLVGGMAFAADTSVTRPARNDPRANTAVVGQAPAAPSAIISSDIARTAPEAPEAQETPQTPATSVEAPSAAPAPPSPPTAPAAPAAPASAAPAPGRQSVSANTHNASGNWIWSNNGEKLEIDYTGTFELTDDDGDIQSLSPGGHMKISDAALVGRHTVEIDDRGGQVQRRYYVNGIEHPYEPEGRDWLRNILPRFVRNSGIGADKRVARFLRQGGVPAVLGEIARIDSSYVKGVYFKQLVTQATLTPDQYRDVMAQAGRELKSDYELATLLIAIADRIPADDASRTAYFTAAGNISSSYELRRVYSAMLKKGRVTPSVLGNILDHAAGISSDYDESELLREVLATQQLDDRTRPAFFNAMGKLSSDYERHRVLSAVLKTNDRQAVAPALAQANAFTSDYEAASLLLEVLAVGPPEGSLRDPFFRAANKLSSAYEKARVLSALVSRVDVGHDTLLAALRAARSIGGSYECSQVLVAAATAHALTGDLGDAYIDAASKLGSYEQGQAMAALVKSERRRN